MTDQFPRTARSSTPNDRHPDDAAYLVHSYEHRAYPIDGERPFTIGRDSRCDIMVSEVSVSRQHVELRPEGAQVVLHPVGSTPTYLNDVRVSSPHVLESGDTIAIGTMRFVFIRGTLPVAITLVPAQERMLGVNDYVSDRRPTLTFPIQPVTVNTKRSRPHLWRWVTLAVVILVLIYAAVQFFFRPHG